MSEFEVYVARFAYYDLVQIIRGKLRYLFRRRFVYFHRYFQQKFISMQTIVVVSAGTNGPVETLRWARSGRRAVNCPPLI